MQTPLNSLRQDFDATAPSVHGSTSTLTSEATPSEIRAVLVAAKLANVGGADEATAQARIDAEHERVARLNNSAAYYANVSGGSLARIERAARPRLGSRLDRAATALLDASTRIESHNALRALLAFTPSASGFDAQINELACKFNRRKP